VLVLRDDSDARLRALLEAAGAEVVHVPLFEEVHCDQSRGLHEARARAASHDVWVFTSTHAVRLFVDDAMVRLAASLPDLRVASVGAATSAALRSAGLPVHIEAPPEASQGEGIAEALVRAGVDGVRVLHPRNAGARPVMQRRLEAAGALVTAIDVYAWQPRAAAAAELADLPAPDWIPLTSADMARTLIGVWPLAWGDMPRLAALGPVTADALHAMGRVPALVAPVPSLETLVTRMAAHDAAQPSDARSDSHA
jgi:uroporphyrinogen-III synthase